MLFHVFALFLVFLSLLGAYLNAKKSVYSFYIWAAANTAWLFVDAFNGLLEQALLYFCFLALNLYGLYEWKKK